MKQNLVALLCGMIGMAVVFLAWSAWIDHQRVNTLWQLAVENAQRQQAMAAPQQQIAPKPEATVKR